MAKPLFNFRSAGEPERIHAASLKFVLKDHQIHRGPWRIRVFFARAPGAITARKLGCLILTRTMERRRQVGLDSYDRFFHNQDMMLMGGFGI